MKKLLFVLSLCSFSLWSQNETSFDFNRSKLDPTQDEPTLDGTRVPVEDINTAPSPVPEFEEEAFPGTIVPDEGPQPAKPRKKLPKDKVLDEA
jgi:hypothetical protein